MPTVDIIILTVIGLSFIFGAWRGFVKEVLSLIFWIGAIVLATMYAEQGAVYFASITENAALQHLISFVLIFFVTILLGGFITGFFTSLTSAAGLKLTNRVLGALFGIVRGVFIVALFIMLAEPFEAISSKFIESQTVPHLNKVVEQIQELLEKLPVDLPMTDSTIPA